MSPGNRGGVFLEPGNLPQLLFDIVKALLSLTIVIDRSFADIGTGTLTSCDVLDAAGSAAFFSSSCFSMAGSSVFISLSRSDARRPRACNRLSSDSQSSISCLVSLMAVGVLFLSRFGRG